MISRSVRPWRITSSWQPALAQQRCGCIPGHGASRFGAAALLVRRGYASSNNRRFTSEEMESLIRNPSMRIPKAGSKTAQSSQGTRGQPRSRRRSVARADMKERRLTSEEFTTILESERGKAERVSNRRDPTKDHANSNATLASKLPGQDDPQSLPQDAATIVENSESTRMEHSGMPDIENYEPTEAELAEMLESAQAVPSDDAELDSDHSAEAELEIADAAESDSQYDIINHKEYDNLASEDDILFETPTTEAQPKTRPFKHELLTHQYLGVAALGQPVEALILKDPNRMKRIRKSLPLLELESTEAGAPVELQWTDYIDAPGDAKDSTLEAWDNIEEMRPAADASVISAHEYHKLVMALVDGFTRSQLSSYITMKHAEELDAEAGAEEISTEYTWIQKQTPWKPAFEIELEDTKPKYVLSAAIIDKVWKVEVREQVENLGRVLLWVHPTTFQLLTGHGRHVLESIQRDMLNPGNNERLAAKSEESRIGIYASKSAIPPVISRLAEIAKSITSSEISVESLKKENLQQPILDNLARITNTIIEKDSSGKSLKIHWIADNDRPKPSNTDTEGSVIPEGPADIVWRLLVAAQTTHTLETDISPQILTHTTRGKPKGALYMDYHREVRSMSWCDKLRSWSRYVGAVAMPSDKQRLPLQLAARVEFAQLPASMGSDAARTSQLTMATFGHVLHSEEAAKDVKGKNADKARRILSPVIPHPAALMKLSASDEPVTQSTAIVLNFSPDTTQLHDQQDDAATSTLPRVRLTLPVDETTDLSNFDFPPNSTLNAISTQRVQDLLLPSESVDVRLTQQQLVSLDVDQPALRKFLSASEFNLLEGRLRTPSRIAFSSILNVDGKEEVPYLFMGLEVHQSVETALGGHTIRYESIEAGQHGGQRQELSLHRAPPRTEGVEVQGGGDDGFLQLIENVATGNVFSWNDGHKLMQERSQEQFTMDMLEDGELEEEFAEEDGALETEFIEEEAAAAAQLVDDVEVVTPTTTVEDDALTLDEQDQQQQQQQHATTLEHDDAQNGADVENGDASQLEESVEQGNVQKDGDIEPETTSESGDAYAATTVGEELVHGDGAVSPNTDATSSDKL